MAADPVNKPKSGPIPVIDPTAEDFEREAEEMKHRLGDVTARLQRAIGGRTPKSATPPLGVPAFRPRRVLVIEDDREARTTISGLITRLGHDVQTATNGLDGLLQLQSYQPDVAMIDLAMPGLDGYTVARRIRAALGDAAPTLIAYTGYVGTAIRSAALDAGFDHYVVQPMPIDELIFLLSPQIHAGGASNR